MSDQPPMAMNESGAERLLLLCTADEAVLGGAGALAAVGYAPLQCGTVKEVQRELSDAVAAVVLDADLPKGQDRAQSYRFSNLLHNQINLTPRNLFFADFLVNYWDAQKNGLRPPGPLLYPRDPAREKPSRFL